MRGLLRHLGAPAGTRARAAGRVLVALAAVLLLDACAVHRRMAIPGQPPSAGPAAVEPGGAAGLRPGDHVRIQLQSGTVLRVVVAEVRPEAIVTTQGQRIPYESMTRLEKRHVSVVATTLLVGGGLGLLAMVMVGVALASLAGGL